LKLSCLAPRLAQPHTARIQVNGETVKEINLANDVVNQIKRQSIVEQITFSADAFVTVEVIGEAHADYQIIYPEISPYAFSNAIYVDANADGEWQAPGL